ncbi:hypothetical protein [Streptosporangium sp. NPDC004631]
MAPTSPLPRLVDGLLVHGSGSPYDAEDPATGALGEHPGEPASPESADAGDPKDLSLHAMGNPTVVKRVTANLD